MQNTTLYAIALIGFIILIIALEWKKIKSIETSKLLSILIILFFIGSALAYFFTY